MAISVTKALPDLSKLEPLDGTNYKRWSQKLLIFFEQLDVDYVLFTTPEPEASTETSTVAITSVIPGNRPQDDAKAKYDRDNKTELISHMRTEEANRLKDKEISNPHISFKANLVESSTSSKNRFQHKGKKQFQKNGQQKTFKANDGKIQKNKLTCYCCGKPGHKAYQCFQRKDQKNPPSQLTPQANLTEQEEIIAAVVVEANLVENKTDWILDTGASKHFCSNKELFQELHEAPDGECVFMGNSTTAGVLGKGKIFLKLTSGKTLALNDVLYVPSLRRNLVSGSLLNKAGLKIVLEADKVIITKNGDFVGKGYMLDGLFVLNTISASSNKAVSDSAYLIESINIWHGRLGHVNYASIKRLNSMNLINASDLNESTKCDICVEAKFAKKPFKPLTVRSTELLELIHSDLADFKNTLSKGGKKYYMSFVDDFSRYTKIYLLRTKDEAAEMFLRYKTEVENQLDKKIKRLRSDRGGEYSTNFLKDFCEKNGIIHETSAPYTPQQNGVAERKNRTLKEMMNAMLLSSGLPENMWGEAVLSACYVLNRVPHKKLDKTPHELWKGLP
ncbi:UNVERIFIED_CONTAM: Retrovirus-related Pol polyprotein from transposon TNT 1-94 [Sesamum radiatum]|uniref:Retrovirus-related Pol polyprotein from transposon TNT 1-94 n=1 Tax=Sesamum radiatum TaxID=300843 RepID=A0AAW2U9J4_SESRA